MIDNEIHLVIISNSLVMISDFSFMVIIFKVVVQIIKVIRVNAAMDAAIIFSVTTASCLLGQ